MPSHGYVCAEDSKGEWVIIDDVEGQEPATMRVSRVKRVDRKVQLSFTKPHPSLGSWHPVYTPRHELRVAK
jgi:hypothetical protein